MVFFLTYAGCLIRPAASRPPGTPADVTTRLDSTWDYR